jgi:hypothetical protein
MGGGSKTRGDDFAVGVTLRRIFSIPILALLRSLSIVVRPPPIMIDLSW